MLRIPLKFVVLLIACGTVLASCGGRGILNGGGGTPPGTAPVVLTMTDTPPTNVSVLSAQVTLTGATLSPGNVPVFSGSTTVELTRLQTDVAYLGTTLVPPGSYTGIMLTFSNPKLTIENDTGSSIATTCLTGTICTIQPVATNLSTTIALSPAMTVSATSSGGLLVDVNLNNLLSATLGADFINGVSVSQFIPASTGLMPVVAEDVVGAVASTDATHSKFSLQNAVGTVSLTVDNSTTFLNFPTGTCTTFSIACVQANQILSVDISIQANGTPVARNVLFEDADSSDIEVEGIITGTGSLTFNMVTLAESTVIPSLPIGTLTTVTFTGLTPSSVDFTHVDSTPIDTSAFPFSINVPADLMVGQEVQVRRNPASSSATATIVADRVRLRSSRMSGTYQSGPATLFILGTLPSLFNVHAIQTIQVQTSSGSVSAICTGIGIGIGANCSSLVINHNESVRGPLFANSGNPTLIATRVLQH
jgi:hypothetical protein